MANPIIESAAQIAARLGVSVKTINRRVRKGTMAAIKHPTLGKNGFINLFITPAEVNTSENYAAAQDLGERLARQIEINQVLRAENVALASRPCLACNVVHPPLHERRLDLEALFEQACELLGQIDAGTVSLHWGSIVSFIRDRRELNAARRPTEAANGPV